MKRINIQTNLDHLTLEDIAKVSKFDLSKEFTLHAKDGDKEISRNFKPFEARPNDYIFPDKGQCLSQGDYTFHLVSR